jgi:hypothetical protein
MKQMILWQIHQENRQEVFSAFASMELADYQSQQGSAVKILGRWHDVINGTGVAICETDDLDALAQWLMPYQAVCDFEMVPVLDDAEAHATARKAYPVD